MPTTQAQKLNLEVQERNLFGKKVRKLRADGVVVANIFGPDFKSKAISTDTKQFNRIYRIAEETGIVYLTLGKEEIPVLIKNVQHHPVTHTILHVDFRKVDLKQKVETQVPIKILGESPAVLQKGGVLLTQSDEIAVEALPQDIPHEIEIDISKMAEIGDEIKVADLPKNPAYEVKEEPEKVIVSIVAHKEESLAPETAPAAEPEVITEKEGEEVLVEGEEAPEGKKAETKEEKKPAEAKAPEGKEQKTPEKAPQQKEEKK